MQKQHELAGNVQIIIMIGSRLFMQHGVNIPETSWALPAQLNNGMCLLLCTRCREHIVCPYCPVCLAMIHQTHAIGYPPHLHQTVFFLRLSITTSHMTGYHHKHATAQPCLRTAPASQCIHHERAHAMCVKDVSNGAAR